MTTDKEMAERSLDFARSRCAEVASRIRSLADELEQMAKKPMEDPDDTAAMHQRADLLEQLCGDLDGNETTGIKGIERTMTHADAP